MTFQYMIWRKGKLTEHLVFNQNSLRVVYPPSHPFYQKNVQPCIMMYENRGWECIDQGAWRGDHIDEYMEAMRKVYPKALQKKAEAKRTPFRFMSEKDRSQDGVSDDREPD